MDLSKANIPVIDISPSNPNAPEQLLSAASKYGFVFIKNSPETGGIPPQDIAKMFELSKEFFAAPVEVKEQVSIASNKAGKNHGWLSQGIEKLDPKTQKRADVKEYATTISRCPPENSKLTPPVHTERSTWASPSRTTPSSNPSPRPSHHTSKP
jgi:isopenicillin N synthase-like dioxygenase